MPVSIVRREEPVPKVEPIKSFTITGSARALSGERRMEFDIREGKCGKYLNILIRRADDSRDGVGINLDEHDIEALIPLLEEARARLVK